MPQEIHSTAISIVSAFSLAAWTEIAAASLVAIGCMGEFFWIFRKPPPEDSRDFLKAFETRKRKWEISFALMVAIGVTAELIMLPISLKDVLELETQLGQTKTNVTKIDPINQPLSDVFALVTVKVKGKDFIESPLWGSPAIASMELCDNRTNVGHLTIASNRRFYSTLGEFSLLSAFDFNRVNFLDGQVPERGCHGYILRFQPDILLLGSGFSDTYPPTAGEAIRSVN